MSLPTFSDLWCQASSDGHYVEPDNVDGYVNDTGLPLTARDQVAFNRFLANAAHERGLSVGLKNDLDQIAELVDYFDCPDSVRASKASLTNIP